ncbi:MAG TPA: hypothetical protein DCM05_06400 [Elusimicrobia bacterium]|nr:hypothetical protein [Elusimicrobiota bacterium]
MEQGQGLAGKILSGAAALTGGVAAGAAALVGLLSFSLLLPVWTGRYTFYIAVFGAAVFAGLTRRWWKPWPAGPFLLRLGSLVMAVWVVVAAVHGVVHRRFDRYRGELKAKGLPVSLAEFAETLPDDRYGEAAYEAAFARLDPEGKWPGFVAETKVERWSADSGKKTESLVRSAEPALLKELVPLSGRFSRYKKVDYAAAGRRPFDTQLPKFGPLMKAANMLKLCAAWRAWRGEPEKAWAHVRLLLDMGDLILTERSALAKAVVLRLRRFAAEAALMVKLNAPGAALPKDLAARFKKAAVERPMSEGLEAEVAMWLDMRDSFEREPALGAGVWGGPDAAFFERALGRWAVAMGLMDVNIQASAEHHSSWTQVESPDQLRELERRERELEDLPLWPCMLARLATPRFSGLLEKQADLQALLRQTAGPGLFRRAQTDLPHLRALAVDDGRR